VRRLFGIAAALLVTVGVVLAVFSRPVPLPASVIDAVAPGDPDRGAAVFWAGGCASCHAAPGAVGEARLVLAGGRAFVTDFGTFRAPNISADVTHGIGGWSWPEFANAMMAGLAPDGRPYYPAFPYTAYRLAAPQDMADLYAFLQTLPADATSGAAHDLRFPYNIRRGVGLWKRLALRDGWAVAGPLDEDAARGRYLAEALAHCGECHTPRDRFGRLDRDRWMAGAPNPSGEGVIPDIRPAALGWSREDVAVYLRTGFTPGFDLAGGTMADVVKSLAELPEADTDAIAAYLLALP